MNNVEINIDKNKNIVFFEVGETFDYEHFEIAFKKAVSDKSYDKNMNIMWDLRKLKFSSLFKNTNELRKIFNFVKENESNYGKGFKMAIVTSSDLVFGIARMYEMISEGLPFERMVFRDYEDALSWLYN